MTTITVRTQFEGVHRYSNAPDEVAYLREPHRHMFGVEVEMEVFSDDREVEFVMVKHTVDGWLAERYPKEYGVWQMGTLSCEQVASSILDLIHRVYCNPFERRIRVHINEDGENGATVDNFENWGGTEMFRPMPPADKLEPWTLNKYQHHAYQNIQPHDNDKEEAMHWAIGLGEEAGEALSVIKHRYYGGCYRSDEDMLEDLVVELGDALWHIAALCTAFGLNLSDVAMYNILKLENRYPHGKFEHSQSEARHEVYGQWKLTKEHEEVMKTLLANRKENMKEWEKRSE